MEHLVVTENPVRGKLYHVPINSDLEQMLISAERYACGRATYIVGDTINYIKALFPYLSEWCLTVMVKDIEDEIKLCERSGGKIKMGMQSDHAAWIKFKAELQEELKRRNAHDL